MQIPVGHCKILLVHLSSCKALWYHAIPFEFLWFPAIPCESLQVPASSCEFLRVPLRPCESLWVPLRLCESLWGFVSPFEALWAPESSFEFLQVILSVPGYTCPCETWNNQSFWGSMSLFSYSSQTRIEIGRVCNTASKLQPYSELDLARYYLVVVVLSPSKSKKKLLKIILSKGIFLWLWKSKKLQFRIFCMATFL